MLYGVLVPIRSSHGWVSEKYFTTINDFIFNKWGLHVLALIIIFLLCFTERGDVVGYTYGCQRFDWSTFGLQLYRAQKVDLPASLRKKIMQLKRLSLLLHLSIREFIEKKNCLNFSNVLIFITVGRWNHIFF